jgi:hypothetical protein
MPPGLFQGLFAAVAEVSLLDGMIPLTSVCGFLCLLGLLGGVNSALIRGGLVGHSGSSCRLREARLPSQLVISNNSIMAAILTLSTINS